MKQYLPKINSQPVIEKIKTNHLPEELFAHFTNVPDTSLLNSSMQTDAGRYSFLGIEPFLVLSGKNNSLCLRFSEHKLISKNDSFEYLDSIIKTYSVTNQTSLPFIAGGIGYFSYDLKDTIERLPQKAKDDLALPDIYFVFYQALLIHDKLEPDQVYISVLDIDSPERKKPTELMKEMKKICIDSCFRRNDNVGGASGPEQSGNDKRGVIPARHSSVIPAQAGIYNFESNFTKLKYIKSVQKIIDYIRAGDIYQACLSQRFKTEWPRDPYQLYLKLNSINPAPFSSYLNFAPAKIISSSPEMFLRMQDNHIQTRPMKGTRARGETKKQDTKLKNDLKKSLKDNAELSMIVDLERNDLGKVCVPGSVKVTEHRRIETYPTVFQTISVVKGKVNNNTSPIDIIKAAFPGGSITGCPKIRAMEIIDELEPTKRGVYTGSIGYISFHDTMDLSIAIRTMVTKGKDVYFAAGGGITADSDPEAEYTETLDKVKALIDSLCPD